MVRYLKRQQQWFQLRDDCNWQQGKSNGNKKIQALFEKQKQ